MDSVSESEKLEEQGLGILKKYGLWLPGIVKDFLIKVAVFNQWQKLKKELEK